MSIENPNFSAESEVEGGKNKKEQIAQYFRKWAEIISKGGDRDILEFCNRLNDAADCLTMESMPPGALSNVYKLLEQGVDNELNHGGIVESYGITREDLLGWKEHIIKLIEQEKSH